MLNIGIIVAMKAEIPDLFYGKSGVHQVGDCSVSVVISGIGQKKARYSTREMCSGFHGFQPDYLLVLGFCGGTRDELDIGQLIIAERVTYNKQEIVLENRQIEKVLNSLKGMEYHKGKLQTFDWPVFSQKKISDDTLAVDMEAFAIVQTARDFNLPVMIIKAVSDLVPEKANLKSLFTFLKTIRNNAAEARAQLNECTKNYFL